MSVDQQGSRVIHYPKDPKKFVFDQEVSSIFPDMADRSIPMYREAHRYHAAFLARHFGGHPFSLIDIGASRGHFIRELCTQLQIDVNGDPNLGGYDFTAIDPSESMVRLMREDMTAIPSFQGDIRDMSNLHGKIDVVALFYVLQFLETNEEKRAALAWARRNMKDGGILLLGQKEAIHTGVGRSMHDEYIEFRVRNWYSREEIQAKTEALKNSMWPISSYQLMTMAHNAGFSYYQETLRWGPFSTAICVA